jgi:hypothetical protein
VPECASGVRHRVHELKASQRAEPVQSEARKLLDADDDGAQYLQTFRKCLKFADDLGIRIFRVDTVQPPEILNQTGGLRFKIGK